MISLESFNLMIHLLLSILNIKLLMNYIEIDELMMN